MAERPQVPPFPLKGLIGLARRIAWVGRAQKATAREPQLSRNDALVPQWGVAPRKTRPCAH
ncbi:MAG: hypothetical protein JWM33_621 [Caulobacteraceae bacterium]|nr:hypothetical protein [Caulobacteraceae bacterium]